MRSKYIENKSKHLKLSKTQKDILVGTLLGDGHLETKNDGKTYRLKIEHCIQQKEYTEWLFAHFSDWAETLPGARTREVAFRDEKKMFERIGFSTISTGSLRFFAHQFYRNGKKIVPKLIHRWMSPLALAVWYMDDGSIKSNEHKSVLLNTQGFSAKDLEILQKALEKQYGIKTKQREKKDGIQLYLLSETVDIFLRLIEPFVLESMRYKLPHVWLTPLPKM